MCVNTVRVEYGRVCGDTACVVCTLAHRCVWPVWRVRYVFHLHMISVASALGMCEDLLCGLVPGLCPVG